MTNTQKCRLSFWILFALSFLCQIGPLAYFCGFALFVEGALIVEKVALMGSVVVALILSGIGWMNRTVYRSKIFIILLALYLCLESIVTPLLIIGGCQILDEVIISPCRATARTRLITNKELDKRL